MTCVTDEKRLDRGSELTEPVAVAPERKSTTVRYGSLRRSEGAAGRFQTKIKYSYFRTPMRRFLYNKVSYKRRRRVFNRRSRLSFTADREEAIEEFNVLIQTPEYFIPRALFNKAGVRSSSNSVMFAQSRSSKGSKVPGQRKRKRKAGSANFNYYNNNNNNETVLFGSLVDPASSHMLVSKVKPCKPKYKLG